VADGRPNWILVLAAAVIVPLMGLWVASAGFGRRDTSDLLGPLSVVTLVIGLVLVAGYAGLARWAGADRDRNAAVFPVTVTVALVVVGLLTLAQVGIVLLTLYTFAIAARLFAFIAIAGVIATVAVLRGTRELLRTPTHFETALRVRPDQAPTLWGLVSEVAAAVKASPPRNLIVGLQPGFYATGARVALEQNGRTMSGETLYLSIPSLRLLTRDEVMAVVGHELGHLKGADVAYTRRFSPAFAGLSSAVHNTQLLDDDVIQRLARWPALTFSRYLLSVFATNERRIRRDREFAADLVGAAASSATALAAVILKLSAFSDLWPRLQRLAVAEVQAGLTSPDMAAGFEALARREATALSPGNRGSLLRERTTHPFDTHPPTGQRLDALGVNANELDLTLAHGWAGESEVDAELSSLGEELTRLEMPLIEAFVARRAARTPRAV
jgi:Zn-dependent protease with chaperone function